MKKLTRWLGNHLSQIAIGALSVLLIAVAALFVAIHGPIIVAAFEQVNPSLWVAGNVLVLYIFAVISGFTAFYGLRFRWFANQSGVVIFSFVASLVGAFLLIIIGVFIDGRQAWYSYPEMVAWWRPAFRDLIYLPIAITSTFLLKRIIDKHREQMAFEFSIDPRARNSKPLEDTISDIETR